MNQTRYEQNVNIFENNPEEIVDKIFEQRITILLFALLWACGRELVKTIIREAKEIPSAIVMLATLLVELGVFSIIFITGICFAIPEAIKASASPGCAALIGSIMSITLLYLFIKMVSKVLNIFNDIEED